MKPRTSGKDLSLDEAEFKQRYRLQFRDSHFSHLALEIEKITEVAWDNYKEGRKAPLRRKAGSEFQNPNYELSSDWLLARARVHTAQEEFEDKTGPRRILLISASSRNDQTCPGEISKSMRMVEIAQEAIKEFPDTQVELLDLSLITSEYGKTIHPCKACVSTAMPLCHWPCSCYPHHSLGQIHDWMNDIYPMWVRAHGIMIITPVYWHQAPSSLKLMIDRLVCADGGNTDPTSTDGKNAEIAKELELKGWNYPRHLKGRLFSLMVHGDVAGVDHLKSTLTDWLEEMELIPVSNFGLRGRYIGYMGSYAENHKEFDKDKAVQEEVRNSARALATALKANRNLELEALLSPELEDPRPK